MPSRDRDRGTDKGRDTDRYRDMGRYRDRGRARDRGKGSARGRDRRKDSVSDKGMDRDWGGTGRVWAGDRARDR